MYCDIDDRDSESNFENSYHNPVLIREHHGLDEQFVDKEFQYYEENDEDHSQCFVN
jgi:hypothetical protein